MCDDVVYKSTSTAAASSSDGVSASSLLRAHIGNRRRSSRLRPEVMAAKGLTKLFFEPAAVLEAIFDAPTGAGASSSSDPDAAEPSVSQISSSQEEANVARMTVAEREALLLAQEEGLRKARLELSTLRREATEYVDLRACAAADLARARTDVDAQTLRLKRYTRKSTLVQQEAYRLEKRAGEMREEARRAARALVALDAADRAADEHHREQLRHAAAAAASSAAAVSPSSGTAAVASRPSGVFLPPTTLSASHRYLQLPHNDVWRDFLLLDPNLRIAAHEAVHGSTNTIVIDNADTNANANEPMLVNTASHAPPNSSLLPPPPPPPPRVPAQLDLLELGLADMASLRTPATLAEMARVVRSDASLATLMASSSTDGPPAAVPPAPEEPSDSTLSLARQNASQVQQALFKLLQAVASDPLAHRATLDERRARLLALESTRRLSRARNEDLLTRLRRTRELIQTLSRPTVAPAPEPVLAVATESQETPAVRKRQRRSNTSRPESVTMDLTKDAAEDEDAATDDIADGAEEQRTVNLDKGAAAQVSDHHRHDEEPPLPRFTVAPPSSTAAPSRVPTYVPTSSFPAHARSSFLLQAAVSSNKQRLAAALEAVERLEDASAAGSSSAAASLARATGGVTLADLTSLAARAPAPPPPPPPRANPFGIPTSSAGVAAARARPPAARTIGGDLIVRGHDGRGGHVHVLRSAPPAPVTSNKSVPTRPGSPSSSSGSARPSSASSSASPFSLDSLAYRPREVSSTNTRTLARSSSSGGITAVSTSNAAPTRGGRAISHDNSPAPRSTTPTRLTPQTPRVSLAAALNATGTAKPNPSSVRAPASSRSFTARPLRASSPGASSPREIVDLVDSDEGEPAPAVVHPFFARANQHDTDANTQKRATNGPAAQRTPLASVHANTRR